MNWVDFWGARHDWRMQYWRRAYSCYGQRLVQDFDFSAQDQVLDYGSGPGFLGEYLAAKVEKLILLEPSSELCTLAARANRDRKNVQVICGSVEQLSSSGIQTESLDKILINSVLQYVPKGELKTLLNRLANCLRPGGQIIISDLIPEKKTLLRDLMDVFYFLCRNEGPGAFFRYVAMEIELRKNQPKLELSHYSKAEVESALSQDFCDARWIPNLSLLRGRNCVVATRRVRATT